jgi:hypothetical protein
MNVTNFILKLCLTIIVWVAYMGVMAEYILSRPNNEWLQVTCVMIGLFMTVGCIKYTVNVLTKFLKR